MGTVHMARVDLLVMIPGGGVDDGEEFEAAAKRECWEESGVDVTIGEHVLTATDRNGERHYFAATPVAAPQLREFVRGDADGGTPTVVRFQPVGEALAALTSEYDRLALVLAARRVERGKGE